MTHRCELISDLSSMYSR